MYVLIGTGLSYWAFEGLWAGITGGRACPLHQARTGHIGHILWIFFKNTSNILEYARIYSNILDISLSGGHGGLTGKASGRVGGRARAQTTLDRGYEHPGCGTLIIIFQEQEVAPSCRNNYKWIVLNARIFILVLVILVTIVF
jgi:hypothetical protein